MNQEKPKTDRMDINSTQRIDVDGSSNYSKGGDLLTGAEIKGYKVLSLIATDSGEAEIYTCVKENTTYILKHYYRNFKPKEDILQKIHKLNHPDIITLHEYGYHNSRFFEIMEYAEGGTLVDKDTAGKYRYLPMKEEQVIQVVTETINAFKYFHEKGIIHRDIKPANLFYKNSDGSDILVGDFGISSELDVDGGMSKRMTSTIALSDGYAAPELYGIAKDDNKAKILIGPEVDYYALGITVYELLTGINPFTGRNPLHIMRDTIEGRVVEDLLSRNDAKSFSAKLIKLLQGLLTIRHDKRWGYDQVSKWLKGEDVEVFAQINHNKLPVLKFGDKEINTIDGLVKAIDNDRELGKKYIMRGMLESWAMKFDESLANEIIDIKELDVDDSEKISILLFKLDPSLPCRISDDIIINNINDILELLRNRPDFMGDIILNRIPSGFYPWIDVHYNDLSKELAAASENLKRLKDNTAPGKIKTIFSIYLTLAGDCIKPFANDDLEIRDIRSLINVPNDYQEKVIKELCDEGSILSLWMDRQGVEKFKEAWRGMGKTWENLTAILTGNIVFHMDKWKTNKQKVIDEKKILEEKEFERTREEERIKENKRHHEEYMKAGIKNTENEIKKICLTGIFIPLLICFYLIYSLHSYPTDKETKNRVEGISSVFLDKAIPIYKMKSTSSKIIESSDYISFPKSMNSNEWSQLNGQWVSVDAYVDGYTQKGYIQKKELPDNPFQVSDRYFDKWIDVIFISFILLIIPYVLNLIFKKKSLKIFIIGVLGGIFFWGVVIGCCEDIDLGVLGVPVFFIYPIFYYKIFKKLKSAIETFTLFIRH